MGKKCDTPDWPSLAKRPRPSALGIIRGGKAPPAAPVLLRSVVFRVLPQLHLPVLLLLLAARTALLVRLRVVGAHLREGADDVSPKVVNNTMKNVEMGT